HDVCLQPPTQHARTAAPLSFFFQAEDGIRDFHVTGVQTCALPILKYNEFLGAAHFWVMFVGVNVIFFPQHFLGLQGMPRRYIDYPDAYTLWNHVSSVGYAITLVGVVIFLVMLLEAAVRRRKGVANPWGEGATTLEWTLSSPPPHHQFNELPVVKRDEH